MKILIDTCVLSEARHPSGNPSTKKAVRSYDENSLFLSVLTVGEITKGIFLLLNSLKKTELIRWLHGLETLFSDRLLPINRETTQIWGEMTARAQTESRIIPTSDGLIAPTALCYGLHIMTCNVRPFQGTGAFIIDPSNETNLIYQKNQ